MARGESEKERGGAAPTSGLAANMRALRKARGWSQTDLAREAGATLTHVSRVETGKYSPSVDFVIKLAQVFGVSVDTLLAEHEDEIREVRIEDKDLTERLRLIETLDDEERQALLKVIDSMLTKKKVLDLLTQQNVA